MRKCFYLKKKKKIPLPGFELSVALKETTRPLTKLSIHTTTIFVWLSLPILLSS